MLKRVLLILHICLLTNFLSNTLSANTDKIKAGTEKIIKGTILKIEVSVKGKKLQNYFENNTLDLFINGEIKQYKFKEKTYEVYSNDKLIESGNWKVGGLLKDNIKLKPKEKSKAYYFKKISKKKGYILI